MDINSIIILIQVISTTVMLIGFLIIVMSFSQAIRRYCNASLEHLERHTNMGDLHRLYSEVHGHCNLLNEIKERLDAIELKEDWVSAQLIRTNK